MIKRILAAVAASCAALAAFAADWAFVDRPLTMTYASGDTVEFVFASDGTYTASTGASGTWTFDGKTFCFSIPDGELCGPFDADRKPGDTWEAEAWDGSGMATISIG
ncbi:MAG: hypothetical protein MI723_08935 [Caulobacterales bacterium]|nr:hypothetical protein [Caulobacterales bacterium]